MHKNHIFRLVMIGIVGMLLIVVLLNVGLTPAAADETAVNDAFHYCTFLPTVVTDPKPPNGAAIVPAPINCLGFYNDLVDFNGDGYGDLAVGIDNDNPAGSDSGAVNVLYGTSSGLDASENERLSQALLGGQSLSGEEFGASVAAGDFNGDGFTDLAVGSPGEAYDGTPAVGQVDVVFGSPDGLVAQGAQVLSPSSPDINGAPEAQDRFGDVLESGDFNNDNYADLAVGSPLEDLEGGAPVENMGAVHIFYGSASGLRVDNELLIHPALPTVDGSAVEDGQFGSALAAGDFNADGYDELAVGIPGYDLNMVDKAGVVQVFSGSASGISLVGETRWRQGFDGIQGNPENGDQFGWALTTGDFDKNGADDLVVGVPNEDVEIAGGPYVNAGAVQIIYGYAMFDGLSGSGDQIWHQGLSEVLGDAENSDLFGFAVLAADFNGDGADDLAVSAPGQVGDAVLQGQVIAFYSNGSILSFDNQDLFMQGIVQGAPEAGDLFGYTLGTADFDGNGIADLAIGSPYEDVPSGGGPQIVDAGAINVVYGQDTGLAVGGNQIFGQHVNGILGEPELNDHYGIALSH